MTTTQQDISKIYNATRTEWAPEPVALSEISQKVAEEITGSQLKLHLPIKATGFLSFKSRLHPVGSMRLRVYVYERMGWGVDLVTRKYYLFDSCTEPEPDKHPGDAQV